MVPKLGDRCISMSVFSVMFTINGNIIKDLIVQGLFLKLCSIMSCTDNGNSIQGLDSPAESSYKKDERVCVRKCKGIYHEERKENMQEAPKDDL